MKKSIVYLFLIFTVNLFAQYDLKSGIQPFQKPNEGKSLVYIIKSGAGTLVNFRAYLDNKFIGVLSSDNYVLVECDPGQHLFWAVSENRDYLEANLLPNKVYVLNAEGQMGMFVAGVSLSQLDPNDKSGKNLFARKIKNSNAVVYNPNSPVTDDKTENISKGLAKYEDLKNEKSSKIIQLKSDLYFEDAEKFQKN
ncbi:hypothetical protein [Flavobacterium sp. N3904]|uniref:hypothetical protein n=1 Tax=Flavobacterium sp. N3904 TaxID=2986835 RepID=UPI0022252F35|nr:hypothetical protein [Flavobacterium sp. N3904]